MSLTDFRRNYTLGTLKEEDLTENPLTLFDQWLQQIIDGGVLDPTAMTLATVSESGMPSQRIVLLKGRPKDHFVFYTNYGSDKANDIAHNNQVSLHFPWYLIERQVKVLGKAYKLEEKQNDAYFASRPKPSQIAATVSNQSKPLENKDAIVNKFLALTEDYKEIDVPRPEQWGGYYVVPDVIEFWQGGEHRIHDRFKYTRISASEWQVTRLNP